jgi:tRNA threonylcarbamoyladenosine biosynthesis protein TsaE
VLPDDLKQGIIAQSVAEWQQIAMDFARHCTDECYLALHGDLGSGKTTFVKGLGMAWHIPFIKSPSFNLVDLHVGTRRLAHVDAYRLNWDSLEYLGLEDFLKPPFCLAVEWPELFPISINFSYHLYFTIIAEGQHKIRWNS